MTDQRDWSALATAVKARRKELRLPKDLTYHGGPSGMTIHKIESGTSEYKYRPKTYSMLERVLQWPLGTVDAILSRRPCSAKNSRTAVDAPETPSTSDIYVNDDFTLAGDLLARLLLRQNPTPVEHGAIKQLKALIGEYLTTNGASERRGERRGNMLALIVAMRELGEAAKMANDAFRQLEFRLPQDDSSAD